MIKTLTKEHFLLLAIGGFLLLICYDFSFFIGTAISEVLIFNDISPLLNIIIKGLTQILVFIILVQIFLKFLDKEEELSIEKLNNYTIRLIIFYILIQVLHFVNDAYGISSFENYFKGLETYKQYLIQNPMILTISSLTYYIQLIAFGFLLIKKRSKDD